ncbi:MULTISPECIES: ASCH domain-containing protein [Geobacillus]|uniref:ASCH domain-containing protein n=2 Tax=Anoxybacillaceae TaxID=3120669 RepID=UPI00064ACD39|nr:MULTISPECIES: ASCH domain-containing protein [Geobacillus]
MLHKMGLYEEPFRLIKTGENTVEVRLNDEKRRKIKIGDTIEFIKVPEENEVLKIEVLELRNYDTFKELYEDIPFKDFGCEGWTMEEMLEATYKIYSPEQEKQWVH